VNHLTKLVEAALFSAAHPLSIADLKALEPGVKPAEVQEAVAALRVHYETHEHGFELVEVADGYQLLTRREYAEAITSARLVSRPRKLSAAAMETLAIIAYRQPVGRAEIEEIRGVAADGVLKALVERGFIDVTGRGEGLGRPLLYGTTPRFLEMLGLTEIVELPRLDQLAVALRPLSSEVLPQSEGMLTLEPEEDEGEPAEEELQES
jgi:segregation and condensation protein B